MKNQDFQICTRLCESILQLCLMQCLSLTMDEAVTTRYRYCVPDTGIVLRPIAVPVDLFITIMVCSTVGS